MTLSGKQRLNLAATAALVTALAVSATLSVNHVASSAEDFAAQAKIEAKSSLESVETIDSNLQTMADRQARSLQRQEEVESNIASLGEQVATLAKEFAKISESMEETNRRVRIVALKGNQLNEVIGDSVESLEGIFVEMPETDARFELEDVYDELYDSQDLLQKEVVLSLENSSESIAVFAERLREVSSTITLLSEVAAKQVVEVKGVSDSIRKTSAGAKDGIVLSSKTVAIQRDILRQSENMQADLEKSMARSKNTLIWICVVSLLALAAVSWILSNSVVKSLVEMIADLSRGKKGVGESGETVSQISSSLAEGSMRLASVTEEISASVQEILSMSRSNMEQSEAAKGQSDTTLESTTNMVKSMDGLKNAMGEIHDSSSEIGGILKTIEEIAFQTNILALNAAVEAARAGEAGSGFAVVADEVRTLATRSSQAAQQTSAVVHRTQDLTDVGHEHCADAVQRLETVLEEMKSMRERCDSITTASSEQVIGIDQLAESVNMMEELAIQLNGDSKQASRASNNMDQQLTLLSDEIDLLAAMVGGASETPEVRKVNAESKTNPSEEFGGRLSESQENVSEVVWTN